MENKFSVSIVITLVLSILPFVLHSSIAEIPEDIQIKSTNLYDNGVGNALGWTPDGNTTFFNINDATVQYGESTILVNINSNSHVSQDPICQVTFIDDGGFTVVCDIPPVAGSQLYYTVFNQKIKTITEAPYGPYPGEELDNASSSFSMESNKDRFQNLDNASSSFSMESNKDRFQNSTS